MKAFYLLGAVLGAVIPWTYNALVFVEGTAFTPQAFFMQGFEGPPMLGSLAADSWIGATVSTAWMVAEARRLKMRRWGWLIVWTLMVAWASALPLFLFLRERHLERD